MSHLDPEIIVRLVAFAGILLMLVVAELLTPRRSLSVNKSPRWASNLGLVVLNTVLVRLVLPVGAVGVAMLARERSWGLFNNVAMPNWLEVILAVIALDLAIYSQHILFHAVPFLWRVHLVHHADLDFDVTTGLRFHTIEILLSLVIKLAAVVCLGAPALAVLIFEVVLNVTSMFSHSNIQLPGWLDRVLRLAMVTPDMHRVHHSAIVEETNSNFGFNLPWWDYVFGTFRAQPAAGHNSMTIGLSQFREEWVDRFHWMLVLPLLDGNSARPTRASQESIEQVRDQHRSPRGLKRSESPDLSIRESTHSVSTD